MNSIRGMDHGAHAESPAGLRLVNAAHEFEAQMMKELVRPMTRFDNEDGLGSGGALTDFAGDALAQSLSRAGGFGIAEAIVAHLSRIEESNQRFAETEPLRDGSTG